MSRRGSSSDDDAVVIDRDDISNYNPEHILPESPAEIKKIREWLQPTEYAQEGGEFRRHLATHMEGTATWLTSSETFRKWTNGSEHGALWIKGIPGSGKSVIAAHLVELLRQRNPGAPVLYFFFRQIIDANHEPAALLRDWLDQVLEVSPPLQKELKELIESGRSLTSLSMDDLWKYLRLALSRLPAKAVCVADALDEMDGGNDDFLRALALFGQWKPHKVKLLITSRPVPSVEVPLRHANMLRIRLDEDMVDVDIASYVERALLSTAFSSAEKNEIRHAVPGRANGIFLYARLAMNSFLEPGAQFNEVLKALPTDLNDTYTNLLREHGARSGIPSDIQRLILQWVTHASRPLRLLELAEMISVTYNSRDSSHSKPDLASAKVLIRAAAGPLLAILPDETVCVIHHSFTEYLKGTTRSHGDGGYPVLELGATHTQLALACLEYLQAGCLDSIAVTDSSGNAESDTDSEDAYERLENRRFYRQEGQLGKQDQRLRLQFPFFAYAVPNWYVHVGKSYAAGYDQTELVGSIMRFLNDEKRRNAWVGGVDIELRRMTSLHIAARFGLTALARKLVPTAVDLNKRDYYGKTAVWWAANRGHADIVRLLVEGGADPNEPDKIQGLTPLHEAANENHGEAVQALLEAAVDPLTPKTRETPGRWCGNAPTSRGHTPLMYTCHNGHLEALKVFLPFLKDIDIVHRALSWSASRGRVELVNAILQHPGVDVNAKYREDTPLYRACKGAHRETILTLLDNGADPNIFCGALGDEFGGIGSGRYWYPGQKKDATRGYTALQALCSSGRRGYGTADKEPEMLQELFPLFLSKGARLDVRTDSGSTLLHAAVNSPVLVRMLLRAGADANALDDSGCAPLHSATSLDSMSVLIEEGHADIDAVDPKDGRTPLLGLLATYSKAPIMKLLEYNPNVKAKDKNGDGPLHITLTQWNTDPEIISALLTAGADPNECNRAGETPLLKMRMDNKESGAIVDLLLKAGSDINLRDHAGLSLLMRTVATRVPNSSLHGATSNDHKDITDLVEKGAKLDIRDYKGRTLLHHAIATQEGHNVHTRWSAARPNRFDFLISLGLDLQAVDYHGNSLLHELALRSHIMDSYSGPHLLPLWNQLISMGVSVNQQNNQGRAVLLQLAAKDAGGHGGLKCDHSTVLDSTISQVQDINQRDHQGLTALHLASTVCVYTTKKLLDAGADPSLASNDSLTPLHLAARARQCNSAGLLLDFLSRDDTTVINAKDKRGRTALYYACQSGRPETVKLLIDAGANTSDKTLFDACAAFEDEQKLWDMPRHAADSEANQSATGLTVDDPSRPTCHNNSDWRSYGFTDAKHSLRLEEIIEMLVAHGCNTASLTGDHGDDSSDDDDSWFNPTLLQSAARTNRSYTFGCFSRALQRRGGATRHTNARIVFQQNVSESLRAAEIIAATAAKVLHSVEQPDRSLFVDFLKQRQFHLMRPWYDAGVNFLSMEKNTNKTLLGLFVEYGYANLLREFGELETKRQLEHGKWHAFDDKNKSGLFFDVDLNAHMEYSDPIPRLLLFTALERATPNMDVLRLLVDEFHVDINQPRYDKLHGDGKYTMTTIEHALHYLAKGAHWWHVHLAMPYLISKGAEINAKDSKGCTPLHVALGGPDRYVGLFHIDAARILVASGADVNACDNDGRSCLASTAGNVDMIRLLIDRGVVIDAPAIFMAIDSSRVDVLKLLITSGGDSNKRRDPPLPTPKNKTRKKKGRWPIFGDDMPKHEIYPLYAAATQHGARSHPARPAEEQRQYAAGAIQLVEALLEAGASPYTAFMQKSTAMGDPIDKRAHAEHDLIAAEKKSDPKQENEEVTLVHELLMKAELVHPILNLPDLDGNFRNAQGLTLLHAAAHKQCLCAPIDSLFESGTDFESSLPSYLDRLIARGADVKALDNKRRNVLHHIFLPRGRSLGDERDIQTFVRLTKDYPELLNQADVNGTTPLHMGLKYAIYQHDTAPAETLITAGANVHAIETNGNTCLHILAFRIYTSASVRALFSKLVEMGLDINAQNIYGETPVFNLNRNITATRQALSASPLPLTALEAVSFFENMGADLFATNSAGQGLLHIAAKETVELAKNPHQAYPCRADKGMEGEKSIARFEALLQKGLDPMMEDGMKRTCLDVAAACGKESLLKLFEGEGDGRVPQVVGLKGKDRTEKMGDSGENGSGDGSGDDLEDDLDL